MGDGQLIGSINNLPRRKDEESSEGTVMFPLNLMDHKHIRYYWYILKTMCRIHNNCKFTFGTVSIVNFYFWLIKNESLLRSILHTVYELWQDTLGNETSPKVLTQKKGGLIQLYVNWGWTPQTHSTFRHCHPKDHSAPPPLTSFSTLVSKEDYLSFQIKIRGGWWEVDLEWVRTRSGSPSGKTFSSWSVFVPDPTPVGEVSTKDRSTHSP